MSFEIDVLVVGGGPAGLAASAEAAKRGAEVVLVDEHRGPGGALAVLGRAPAGGNGQRAADEVRRGLREEAEAAGVSVLAQSVGWGLFDGTHAGVVTPGENLEVQAAAVVIASGAADRLMPFPGWTLPTVMGALDALRLVYLEDAPPGRRPVVYGAGGLGVPVALALRDAGLDVVSLLEAGGLTGAERAALAERDIPAREHALLRAARGSEYVESVVFEAEDGPTTALAADALVLAAGRAPLSELCWIAGCAMEWSPEAGGFVPTRGERLETSVPSVFVAGAAGSICGLGTAVAEGRLAGAAAAAAAGYGQSSGIDALLSALRRARTADAPAVRRETEAVWRLEIAAVRSALGDSEAVLCRCEHVTVRQIRDAIAAGATTPGEVKRLTRAAMGECQGQACRLLLSRAVSQLLDRPLEAVHPVTFRPPVRPIALETLLRRTP